MRKNRIKMSLFASAPVVLLGLVSCTDSSSNTDGRTRANNVRMQYSYVEAPSAPTYSTDAGEVDILLNYAGTSGVSRAANAGSVNDPISGEQLSPGALLPTWKAFQSYTRTTIKDAANYGQTTDKLTWGAVATSGDFKNQNDNSRHVDLFYGATGDNGFKNNWSYLTDLTPYINTENPSESKMPYFSAFLKANPEIEKMITKSGKIYYTPYFDGIDDIERMFIMDTNITEKVLNSASGWDTTTTNGGANPAPNVVQGGFYQPFMDTNNNYKDPETTVTVLLDNQTYDLKVIQTENIIKQQNALLEKGCTGKELAEQFISYIRTAYANFFDVSKNSAGKVFYKNPADLFISQSAAYNTDELIALMRVVKANPGMISGNASAEITTFFPRAASSNRIENIYDFAQIWGVQGVDSEQGNFYVGGDNKVHSLETTKASYDALEYLSQIYDEGLILKDFYTDGANGSNSGFLDKYYKKITEDAKYGFMMYDYSAATCAANDIYAGIGTKQESRKNGFGDKDDEGYFKYSQTGITGILAPLTYWATSAEWTPSDDITSKTGKTLTRYYESNRALKGNSWAIPVGSDNVDGALRLMDIMYSDLGQLVNNFGPVEYWAAPDTTKGDKVEGTYDASKYYVATDLVYGEKTPIVSNKVKASIAGQSGDFWSYSRGYLGSTHGVGNVRPKGANLQATNAYAQPGVANVQTAFTIGNNGVAGDGKVLKLATICKVRENDKTLYTWNTCAPTGFTTTQKDSNNEWTSLSGFWGADKLGKNQGWVSAVTRGHNNDISTCTVYAGSGDTATASTYNKVIQEQDAFNKKALFKYAFSVENDYTYVPSYALSV